MGFVCFGLLISSTCARTHFVTGISHYHWSWHLFCCRYPTSSLLYISSQPTIITGSSLFFPRKCHWVFFVQQRYYPCVFGKRRGRRDIGRQSVCLCSAMRRHMPRRQTFQSHGSGTNHEEHTPSENGSENTAQIKTSFLCAAIFVYKSNVFQVARYTFYTVETLQLTEQPIFYA